MPNAALSITQKTRKCPHEVISLLRTWQRAVSRLLDSRATLLLSEEMYAVFDEASASCALAGLSIGFCRCASAPVLSAEEMPRKILVSMKGKRRLAGAPLTFRDLLPENAEHRGALEMLMAQSAITYELYEEGDGVCLRVAFPRFLADRFDVCAVDAEDVCNRFYDMMLYLAGEMPKHPLPCDL